MAATVKQRDVFIIGSYFCDLVFTGLPELPRLGHEIYSKDFHLLPGGVYNAAIALQRLGVDVVWPCHFGNDPFSQYVKNKALEEGVDGSFFKDLAQPSLHITAAFSFEDERAFLSYSDPHPNIAYREMILETHPKWVFITRLMIGPELEKIAHAGRQAGAKIFMDCQAHAYSVREAQVQAALSAVDIFSPNRAEAERLTGVTDIEGMLEKLSEFTPSVIIKDGANGSFLMNAGDILHVPSRAVKVIDTTGAGDNFDSGFLYGQLHGYSVLDSLRIGNLCGGLSVQGFGGTSTSPTEEELLEKLC